MKGNTTAIITVGFFFDGTGIDGTDQKNTVSNIYKLYEMYANGDFQVDTIRRIYIAGAGVSEAGEKNSVGAATGKFSTGVISKVNEALELVNIVLGAVRKRLLTQAPIKLRYDIFGFSRGAASARHLANMIQRKDHRIIGMLSTIFGDSMSKIEPAGKVRFIGLFDCVTAVAELANGFNPHSPETGDIELLMRPGVAEKVFHITAAHECRYNFALNSVKPAWPEVVLPGAHSDIGGGYQTEEEEYIYLTRPVFERLYNQSDDDNTRTRLAAEKALTWLKKHPTLIPVLSNSEPFIDIRTVRQNNRMYNNESRLFRVTAVVVRRRVLNHWSYVTLSVMCDAASDAGIAFLSDSRIVDNLPKELVPLHQKALSLGRDARLSGKLMGMTTDELRILGKYIHCSANWGSIDDGDVLVEKNDKTMEYPDTLDVFYVNRPDLNWTRTIYNMDGKRILL